MNNTINYSSDVTRKLTKGYGSTSQPIYVDSNGEIQLANNIQANGNADLWFESETDVLNQVKTSATNGDRFISWSVDGTTYAGTPGTTDWYDIIAISPTSIGNATTLLAKQYGSSYNLYVGYTWRNGETQPQWQQLVTNNGGSWNINAATVSRATFGDQNNATHDANAMASNGLYYYSSNGPATSLGATTTDGACFVQAYSTNWVAQIAQDYRNGGLYVRGKNNGTWQAWVGIAKMTMESYPALLPPSGANNWIKVGTSNTGYGLLPSQSGGAGSGHNYLGTSSWYWKYAYIDEIYGQHVAVGGYNNTSYTLSTASFICNSWIRTVGSTGWYNESYAGGWYMTDAKWVRSFNSKPVLIDIGTNNAYGQNGHRLALGLAGDSHISLMLKGGDIMYGFCVNGNGNWYMGKRTSKSFESTSGDAYIYYGSNTFINPNSDNAVSLGGSSNRWSAVYGVKVYNAVWNDYAECRQAETEEPGFCVTETSNGIMIKTTQRLQPGCKITSDTYGTLMGKTQQAKTPIAVAGRVLVYPYRNVDEYHLGDAVCSAPNGTVDIMTREEIALYPERIVGTVSEIPAYKIWHGGAEDGNDDIEIKGRIWVYVR